MATWYWAGDLAIGPSKVLIGTGTGSPEGVYTAPIGSLWLRTNGGSQTSVYVKAAGASNTGWQALAFASLVPSNSLVFTSWYVGKPGAGLVVFKHKSAVPFTLPAGLVNWQVDVVVNPTSTAIYSFEKNGVQFGTLSISSGGVPTWSATYDTVFYIGDVFSIVAPVAQDATLSDVSITAVGIKN